MNSDGVVPDTIDEAPPAKLTILYGNKEVEFGAELTPSEVKDQPQVKWTADPNKYYVLFMVDPDAPSREKPTSREFNHWLVGNILGCDVNSGEVIAEYVGSRPPKNSGLHRYIFLVHEQKEKLVFDEPRSDRNSKEHRRHFSVRIFAKKYGLSTPMFGNYFHAQWDEYVDEAK